MDSKKAKDKEREERLLLRNKNKEAEERAKLIKEGTKRIQEGRQQLLKDRDFRKDEMRKMVHSQLDILEGVGATDSEKSQTETSKLDPVDAQSSALTTKQAELSKSSSLEETKLSTGTVSEVQSELMKAKISQSLGNLGQMDLGVRFKDVKASHSMGDNPREVDVGVKIKDGKQNTLYTRGIESRKDADIATRITRDASKEPDEPRDFLASVDAEIAELDIWLAKYPMQDSKVSSVHSDGLSDMLAMGSKGTLAKKHSKESDMSINAHTKRLSLQLDISEKKETRKFEITDVTSQSKGTLQTSTIEDTEKDTGADSSIDKESSLFINMKGREELSKEVAKNVAWGKKTVGADSMSEIEISQSLGSQDDVRSQKDHKSDSEEDSKDEFNYEQFIRDLDGQGFDNVASTVKKAPKEQERVLTGWNLKETEKGKDSYSIQDEQLRKDALDAREKEIAKQELDLKCRQEHEERLNKLREESEWSLLVKMKEERQNRQAIIKAREDDFMMKKLEFERIEIERKKERFLPSTVSAMREEETLKTSLKVQEEELAKQENEFRLYQERKNREEEMKRDFELAELEKLKDERRRKEESLRARLYELKQKKMVLEQAEKRQSDGSILVAIEKEKKLIEAMKRREEELMQHEIALTRRQEEKAKSVEIQRHLEYDNLSELQEERKQRELVLSLREEEIKNKKAELESLEKERKARTEKERRKLLSYLEEQQNRQNVLDAFENALQKKENHLGKIISAGNCDSSSECRLLQEASHRKENDLRERKEKLKTKQMELDNYEKSILLQEEQQKRKECSLGDEELLAQKEKEVEKRMLEMKLREEQLSKREQSLKERESSLLLNKSSFQKSYEGIKATESPVRSKVKGSETMNDLKGVESKGNTTATEKRPAVPAVPLLAENLTPFLKFTNFSGEEPPPKHEVGFEEWKFEVNCARRNKSYSDQVIIQAILKSLRAPAKQKLLTMDQSATVDEILQTFQDVFGNTSSGMSVMQDFYTATQTPDESVANWGLRLEGIMQKAIDKGQVKKEEKNDLLKEQFWRSLRSEKLKNATRVQYNTISSFELLRREVRAEENEMKKIAGAQHQPIKVGSQGAEEVESDSKLDTVIRRLNSIEKIVKYGKGRGGVRWDQENQEHYKDSSQRNEDKDRKTENTDKKPLN